MKREIFAVVAAIAVIGSAAASVPAASAATAQCDSGCVALYNLAHGKSDAVGVLGASGTNADQGQSAVMLSASSTNQAEDWVVDARDTVHDFYLVGLLSADINKHYARDEVYEYQYAPDGNESGYCLGTSGQAVDGMIVSLRPCGESAKTLWISDTSDQYKGQIPLIAGTDADFTYPLVLTAGSVGVDLTVTKLAGGTGQIDSGQYWTTRSTGPASPARLRSKLSAAPPRVPGSNSRAGRRQR